MPNRSQRHLREMQGYQPVTPPAPLVLSSTLPTGIPAGSSFTLDLIGSGFVGGEVCNYGGINYPALYVNATRVRVLSITEPGPARAVTVKVTRNELSSGNVTFTVT